MSALLLGASALIPSLLLLQYVYARDKNPEPRGLLLRTFLWGAVICVPVVPVAQGLESLGAHWSAHGVWSAALVQAFLGAAIPEEGFKYLVLRRYVWRQPAFDEPLDGVVYGVTASLGFATLENLLYVGGGGLEVAVMRALTAVPQHAFTGMIMGAFLGRARFDPDLVHRTRLLATGLGAAILLHGLYDALLMSQTGAAVLALGVLLLELRWSRGLYGQLQREQLVASPAPLEPTAGWTPPRPTPHSHFGAWLSLFVAVGGLAVCALGWVVVLLVLLVSSGGPEPLGPGAQGLAVLLVLVPTGGFGALFVSALRGLSAPASAVPDGLHARAHLASTLGEPRQ